MNGRKRQIAVSASFADCSHSEIDDIRKLPTHGTTSVDACRNSSVSVSIANHNSIESILKSNRFVLSIQAIAKKACHYPRFSPYLSIPILRPSIGSRAYNMASLTSWDRFVRYVSKKDGSIRYGDPIVEGKNPDIDGLASAGNLKVKVLEGKTPLEAKATGEEDGVAELLGPLTPKDVGIVKCIGINYKTHMAEIHYDPPTVPTMFLKPRDTIHDTRKAVPIPKFGQAKCDYEGELGIVIGKEAKNVLKADALSYVAGYVVANDVSCRDWQMDKDKAGYQPQWCFSKSFDKYAPLGPAIISSRLLGDASGLKLQTFCNGELRQDSTTSDLYFGVADIIAFLSTGQTLHPGDVILTGTPGGVILGMKSPVWLKDGDEVKVEIEGIGRVVNTMKFE
ncbi:hypothetical protein MRB53_041157 [Persea americana]|nr:hypothetical protein MRB53_041157 [Persea americana]